MENYTFLVDTQTRKRLFLDEWSFNLALQIARLDECSFVELPARLNEERSRYHSALSINDGTEGKIFFKPYCAMVKNTPYLGHGP